MSDKEYKFEEASKELDKIIEKLENGNLMLDESVKLFEKAEKLIKICEKNYSEAKGKITIINNNIEKIFENKTE